MRQVGYSESGNGVMYDDLWTVQEAKEAIEQGHVLYLLDSCTGNRSELVLDNGEIRTAPGRDGDGTLDDLPPCG